MGARGRNRKGPKTREKNKFWQSNKGKKGEGWGGGRKKRNKMKENFSRSEKKRF